MPRYEVRAGDQVFTCSLSDTTEVAAPEELASAWQHSFQAGSNSYSVPGSEPPATIDMTPGQLVTLVGLTIGRGFYRIGA